MAAVAAPYRSAVTERVIYSAMVKEQLHRTDD